MEDRASRTPRWTGGTMPKARHTRHHRADARARRGGIAAGGGDRARAARVDPDRGPLPRAGLPLPGGRCRRRGRLRGGRLRRLRRRDRHGALRDGRRHLPLDGAADRVAAQANGSTAAYSASRRPSSRTRAAVARGAVTPSTRDAEGAGPPRADPPRWRTASASDPMGCRARSGPPEATSNSPSTNAAASGAEGEDVVAAADLLGWLGEPEVPLLVRRPVVADWPVGHTDAGGEHASAAVPCDKPWTP